MGIALLLSLIALAAVLLLRYRRGRVLSQAASQLKEARNQPGKRLRLAAPDRPGEELLAQINGLLENRETETRQLREREESLRRQIANVSHDLRTPLTAISGAATVLLSADEVKNSEKNLSLVQDIKSDADSLIAMVENLLSITKIRDGVMPLNKQEEMLEEVAGDALLTIRRRFPAYHISLELSEDILYLPMEPMLIKQVIVNLLENAIRHSGDHDHIRLHLFRQDDWAVVEVRDRGKGISPEVRQAVQSGRPLSARHRPGGRSSLPFWPATGGNQR